MKILIVDDHNLFSEGLQVLLERQNHKVLARIDQASGVLPAIKQHLPDLVMMDYNLGEGNGLVEAQKILNFSSKIKVVMVSLHEKPTLIKEAFSIGVSAYLSKSAAFEEMLLVIQYLERNTRFLTLEQQIILKSELGANDNQGLTARERQVMLMLAQGWSNKLIAIDLRISVKTVEFHRKNLMTKLNLNSLVELSHYAVQQGLLDV